MLTLKAKTLERAIVESKNYTILRVAKAFGETFNAQFEVESTNDFVNIERFVYKDKETAVAVARALTLNYKNVAVHAALTYTGDLKDDYKKFTLKRTIYLEECEDEDEVITENGIQGEEE